MNDFDKIFDKETVERISNFVEKKMFILNNVKDFHEKDKLYASVLEKLENSLSSESNDYLNEFMRLNYQIDSYYYTLAYYLGMQNKNML